MKSYEFVANMQVINELAKDINAWAVGKGFWSVPDNLAVVMRTYPDIDKFITDLIKVRKCALVTTETSEHVESIRKPVEGFAGFSNEEEEVADQIIRLLDYAGHYKLRIGEAIAAKMAKNEGRPFMHGKAF